jgi:hypothetical protein
MLHDRTAVQLCDAQNGQGGRSALPLFEVLLVLLHARCRCSLSRGTSSCTGAFWSLLCSLAACAHRRVCLVGSATLVVETRRGVTAPPLMQAHAASHVRITPSHRPAYLSPHGPTTPSHCCCTRLMRSFAPSPPHAVHATLKSINCAISAPCCGCCPLHNAASSMLAVVVHQQRQHGQQLVARDFTA